jgi:hypothetical protein
LAGTLRERLQNCQQGWLLRWCIANVPPTELAHTVAGRLQNCQSRWLLRWCIANVPPVELAHTVAWRLQNCQLGWLLRWCMANIPPMELAGALRERLQNCQSRQLLRWQGDYKPVNRVGSYGSKWPIHYPWSWPIATLDEMQNLQQKPGNVPMWSSVLLLSLASLAFLSITLAGASCLLCKHFFPSISAVK